MKKSSIAVELASDLLLVVHDLAYEQDATVNSVLENLLTAHLVATKRIKNKSERRNERLIFALQKLLFRDTADAQDWADPHLRMHGFVIKPRMAGLLCIPKPAAKNSAIHPIWNFPVLLSCGPQRACCHSR